MLLIKVFSLCQQNGFELAIQRGGGGGGALEFVGRREVTIIHKEETIEL
jgi:hypothetical protein